jgi:2-hydroxycyclohexanecarboxyl-CoA dehydrogenase
LFEKAKEQAPEMIERLIKTIPLRRAASPDDQAAAVSYFLADDANYITGQVLSVNGGLSMA